MMSRFLLKFACFGLIQAGIALLIIATEPPFEYLSASLDKEARLKQTEGIPRILLVGGSNVAFGIDSPTLEAEFPGHKVVNLGLMAGVGLDIMLAQALRHARAGDIIIVAPEYHHFTSHYISYPAIDLMRIHPTAVADASWTDWKTLCDIGLGYMKHINGRRRSFYRQGVPLCYRRADFNEHGDVVAHRALAETWHPASPPSRWDYQPQILSQRVDQLVKYTQAADRQGVRVVIEFIPLAESSYAINGPIAENIRQAVINRSELCVLNPDYTIKHPDTDFFDSDYHLNWTAKERRSAALAAALIENTTQVMPANFSREALTPRRLDSESSPP